MTKPSDHFTAVAPTSGSETTTGPTTASASPSTRVLGATGVPAKRSGFDNHRWRPATSAAARKVPVQRNAHRDVTAK